MATSSKMPRNLRISIKTKWKTSKLSIHSHTPNHRACAHTGTHMDVLRTPQPPWLTWQSGRQRCVWTVRHKCWAEQHLLSCDLAICLEGANEIEAWIPEPFENSKQQGHPGRTKGLPPDICEGCFLSNRYHVLATAWQTNARPDEKIQSAQHDASVPGSCDRSRCCVNMDTGAEKNKRGRKAQTQRQSATKV